jgi:alanine racemase
VGLMGHLPLADQAQPRANEAAVVQIRHARRAIMAAGFGAPLTHLAATSATLCDPATHFGMVRLGAGLVGIDPSETTELHGASRLTAPIVHSATANAGTQVGYGGTYVTDMSTNLWETSNSRPRLSSNRSLPGPATALPWPGRSAFPEFRELA